MKKILTACFALTLLAGCKAEKNFLIQAQSAPLVATRSDYKICTNDVPSELHAEINRWLLDNNKFWVLDINSYVPVTVVENDFIQLNILQNRLVLSIKKEGGWPQYSRSIKPIHLKWKAEIEKLSEPIK
jgi:hypothetical protein